MTWDAVRATVPLTKAIAWDGCHKIYLLLDDEQVAQMRTYGYDQEPSTLIDTTDMYAGEVLDTLREWFDESCSLRLINSVRTVTGNPNDGFTTLIGQFEYETNDEED